jgi:hypothetical protein
VRDVATALEFYAGLGFATRAYEGAEYGFAILDDVELHLGGPPHRSEPTPHSAYLYVDDADELADRWMKAGADVRTPVDTTSTATSSASAHRCRKSGRWNDALPRSRARRHWARGCRTGREVIVHDP